MRKTIRLAGAFAFAVALCILAVGVAERRARALPGSEPNVGESTVLWIAGTNPAFPCVDGLCRTAPGLTKVGIPDRSFAFRPSPGVFRIVCVGDSTTAGWPYHPRGGYPEWLGEIMRDALPGRRVEILNLGVSAWDAPRIETVFDQALALRPEVILLRSGYNDYPHFRLRHPRGGALGRIRRDAELFLIARSAAFRRLSRASMMKPRPGANALDAVEQARLIVEHRDRLARLDKAARAAGTRLIVLGLPSWSGFLGRNNIIPTLHALETATAEEARALGTPFVPLTELKGAELFVDHVHSNLTGYRLLALAVARALAAEGLPAPAREWRWARVRSERAQQRSLGLDDPDYRTHLEVELTRVYLHHRMEDEAKEHMEAALLAAPNTEMIPTELSNDPEHRAGDVYREVFARLRRQGRVAEPQAPSNRKFAGLD